MKSELSFSVLTETVRFGCIASFRILSFHLSPRYILPSTNPNIFTTYIIFRDSKCREDISKLKSCFKFINWTFKLLSEWHPLTRWQNNILKGTQSHGKWIPENMANHWCHFIMDRKSQKHSIELMDLSTPPSCWHLKCNKHFSFIWSSRK